MAVVTLTWLCLGFPVAFNKATQGTTLQWIGVLLTVDHINQQVIASVPKEKADELKMFIDTALAGNVIALKSLRTLTGKLEALASLLYTVRPFAQPLWAAIYTKFPMRQRKRQQKEEQGEEETK